MLDWCIGHVMGPSILIRVLQGMRVRFEHDKKTSGELRCLITPRLIGNHLPLIERFYTFLLSVTFAFSSC
jgi:hypothetical protein